MTSRIISIPLLILNSAAVMVIAADAPDSSRMTLAASGDVWLQAGQIVKGKHLGKNFHHQWVENLYANLTLQARVTPRASVFVGAECRQWYIDFPYDFIQDPLDVPDRYWDVYLHHTAGRYWWGDSTRPFLLFEAGLFPFKYNPQVRNLGEYLFRSTVHPMSLSTSFDFALARLTGLRLSSIFDKLRADLLLTTEMEVPPYHDFSPSLIVGYAPFGWLDVGAGVCGYRLISVNPKATTPKVAKNSYVKVDGDTAHFSFSGVKLMGRFTLDPKRIFRPQGRVWLFGEEDLKLYVDATVLGAMNAGEKPKMEYWTDPATGELDSAMRARYDTLLHRIPIVVGLNLPALRILDVVAVEVEWWGNPDPNVINLPTPGGSALPLPPLPAQGSEYYRNATKYYREDNLKWSVYARKALAWGMYIAGQVAYDHMRTNSFFIQTKDREETLTKTDNWWWIIKMGFAF